MLKQKLSIDDFIILKKVGKGAFSQVYIVQKKEKEEKDLNEKNPQYAMKIIKKKLIKHEKLIESTILEKNILLNNDHPFITHLKYSF